MCHADQRHSEVTPIRQCTRCYAPRALTDSRGPFMPPISQCTVQHAYILKPYTPLYFTRQHHNVDLVAHVEVYFTTHRLLKAL